MAATFFAAINTASGDYAVYGIDSTPQTAIDDAVRGCRELDPASLIAVPCTPAAADFIRSAGGAPTHSLIVSRSGVMLRSEEE